MEEVPLTLVETVSQWLVNFVDMFGYGGIFVMTFLESTFVPIPSEVTMIPAGYLVHQGQMSLGGVLAASIAGTLSGSLAMYFFAAYVGRRFLFAYGKYFFFGHERMAKLDAYFASHGEISIFTGRLIPGVRHVISFPAGLAHMNLKKFFVYTGAGGALWMTTLIMAGYLIGGSKEMIHRYMPYITATAVGIVVLLIVLYIWRHRKISKGKINGLA